MDPAELAAARGDRLLGQRVDQFAIAARIGIGGMGAVYRAIQVGVDRKVAVKVLHRDLMGNAEVVQRFLQEARASARLQHRYVATTYTSGRTADGLPYIAMEYVPGGSLRQLIDGSFSGVAEDAEVPGPTGLPADPASPLYALPTDRALRLCNQVVSALAQAHRLSIVHRDLKPDNVLLGHDEDEGEQAKIVDFGIAKIADREGMFQTKERSLLGTALYMAPELFQSAAADPRMDVYAAGLLIFEMVTGFLPFERRRSERATPMILVNRRLLQTAPPLVLPGGVPPSRELAQLVAAMLDLEPLRRPAHAGEVRERLREVPELLAQAPLPSLMVPVSGLAAALGSATVRDEPRPPERSMLSPPAHSQEPARPVAQALDVSALLAGIPGVDLTAPSVPLVPYENPARGGPAPARADRDAATLVPRAHDAMAKTLVQSKGPEHAEPTRELTPYTGSTEGTLELRPGQALADRESRFGSAVVNLRATVVQPPRPTSVGPASRATRLTPDRDRETQVQPAASARPPGRQIQGERGPPSEVPRAERATAKPRRDVLPYALGLGVLLLLGLAILLARVLFSAQGSG